MKGTYVNNNFSAPHLGLSLCLSLASTQMHARIHVPTHAQPKDGGGACLLALLVGGCCGFVLVSRIYPRGFQAM